MGWGVFDYPSAPRESEVDHCQQGCTIDDDQVYACSAKACGRDHLCLGCIFTCGACTEDFCEQHIVILDREDGYADYFCQHCFVERLEAALIQAEEAA